MANETVDSLNDCPTMVADSYSVEKLRSNVIDGINVGVASRLSLISDCGDVERTSRKDNKGVNVRDGNNNAPRNPRNSTATASSIPQLTDFRISTNSIPELMDIRLSTTSVAMSSSGSIPELSDFRSSINSISMRGSENSLATSAHTRSSILQSSDRTSSTNGAATSRHNSNWQATKGKSSINGEASRPGIPQFTNNTCTPAPRPVPRRRNPRRHSFINLEVSIDLTAAPVSDNALTHTSSDYISDRNFMLGAGPVKPRRGRKKNANQRRQPRGSSRSRSRGSRSRSSSSSRSRKNSAERAVVNTGAALPMVKLSRWSSEDNFIAQSTKNNNATPPTAPALRRWESAPSSYDHPVSSAKNARDKSPVLTRPQRRNSPSDIHDTIINHSKKTVNDSAPFHPARRVSVEDNGQILRT